MKVNSIYKRAIQALSVIPKKQLHTMSLTECALLLLALPSLEQLADIRQRLAQRLQGQLTNQWIEQRAADQVFATLSALWYYQPSLITGEQLAVAANRLIEAELNVGGPYFKKTAIVTNIYVALFMRLAAKPLPNLDSFLEEVIAKKQFETPPNRAMRQIYLLMRAGFTPKLRPYMYKQCPGPQWQTPLGLALALAVLKDTASKAHIDSILKRLGEHQQNGFWKDSHDSSFLTTAIIAHILADMLSLTTKASALLHARQQAVLHAALQTCPVTQEPLRSLVLSTIVKVIKADTSYEITLLAWMFTQALQAPGILTAQQHMHLSLASLYGWIAYTIYDDFLDGAGQPIKLPLANVAMRTAAAYFYTAMKEYPEFKEIIFDISTKMDAANAWEIQECRFVVTTAEVTIHKLPQYGDLGVLAEHSLGHALGALAVATSQGYGRQVQNRIIAGFRHYLIARQLSDDLQDWAKDMQAGQGSYVVTSLLRHMHIRPGTYFLNDLLPRMQKTFSETTLPQICEYILQHAAEARQAFQKSNILKQRSNLYDLIDAIERKAKQLLDLHAKSQSFLAATKQNKRFK